MIYSSWDIEQNMQKLVTLGHFLPFYPPKKPQNQNFEKWKNLLEISSCYTCVPKITIYDAQFVRYGMRHIFLLFWVIFIWSGDKKEKIWAHWFLAKPKTIAAGVWWAQGVQGDAMVKIWVQSPWTIVFFPIKHARAVNVRVNIG